MTLQEFREQVAALAGGRTFSAGVTLWTNVHTDGVRHNEDWGASIHEEPLMVAHVSGHTTAESALLALREQFDRVPA